MRLPAYQQKLCQIKKMFFLNQKIRFGMIFAHCSKWCAKQQQKNASKYCAKKIKKIPPDFV
jgi:hypothetical protein